MYYIFSFYASLDWPIISIFDVHWSSTARQRMQSATLHSISWFYQCGFKEITPVIQYASSGALRTSFLSIIPNASHYSSTELLCGRSDISCSWSHWNEIWKEGFTQHVMLPSVETIRFTTQPTGHVQITILVRNQMEKIDKSIPTEQKKTLSDAKGEIDWGLNNTVYWIHHLFLLFKIIWMGQKSSNILAQLLF